MGEASHGLRESLAGNSRRQQSIKGREEHIENGRQLTGIKRGSQRGGGGWGFTLMPD